MYKVISNSVFSLRSLAEVRACTSYIVPVPYPYGHFFYIGVQMALPFRKDKKSGVMKHDRENIVCNAYQQHTTCKLEITPDSRKSVVVCLETTTLQLGAGGETV